MRLSGLQKGIKGMLLCSRASAWCTVPLPCHDFPRNWIALHIRVSQNQTRIPRCQRKQFSSICQINVSCRMTSLIYNCWPTSWSFCVTASSAATVSGDRLDSSAMSRCSCSSLLCASTLRERACGKTINDEDYVIIYCLAAWQGLNQVVTGCTGCVYDCVMLFWVQNDTVRRQTIQHAVTLILYDSQHACILQIYSVSINNVRGCRHNLIISLGQAASTQCLVTFVRESSSWRPCACVASAFDQAVSYCACMVLASRASLSARS